MQDDLFSEEERESLKTTYEVSEERIKRVEDDGRFSKQDLDVLRSTEPYNEYDVHVFNKVFYSIITATFEDDPVKPLIKQMAEKQLDEMAKIIIKNYGVSEEQIKRVENDRRFSKQDLDVLRSKGPYNELDDHEFNKVFYSIITATFEDNPVKPLIKQTAEKQLGEMAEIIKENLRSLDFDSYVRTKQYAITGIKSPGNNVAYLITRIYLGAKTFGFTKDSHLDRRIDDHCSSSGYHVSAHLKPMKDKVNHSAQKTNVTENICRLILRALAPVAIVVIIIFSPFALIAPTIPDARKNAVLKNKIGRPSGGHIDLRQGLGNSNDLSKGNPPENLEPGVLKRLQYFKNPSLCESTASTELSEVRESVVASSTREAERGEAIQNDSKNSPVGGGTPTPGNKPANG